MNAAPPCNRKVPYLPALGEPVPAETGIGWITASAYEKSAAIATVAKDSGFF